MPIMRCNVSGPGSTSSWAIGEIMSRGLVVPLFFMLTVATTAHTADLSTRQIEELTVFGLRAMGAAANTDDVKEILSPQEIEKLVRAGLNFQGRLCARITEIDPQIGRASCRARVCQYV